MGHAMNFPTASDGKDLEPGNSPEYYTQRAAAFERLNALAVTRAPRPDPGFRNGRMITSLWCRGEHDKKDQQPIVNLNQKDPLTNQDAVPTYLVAIEKLITIIERDIMVRSVLHPPPLPRRRTRQAIVHREASTRLTCSRR